MVFSRHGQRLGDDWPQYRQKLAPGEARIKAKRDLSIRIGAMVEIWASSMSNYSRGLFSGEDPG